MREILFRGKCTDTGEWVEGMLSKATIEKPSTTEVRYNIQEFNYGYLDESTFEPTYTSGFDYEVTPETVGQYTGLTDSNGKKIFEGDILQNGKHKAVVTANIHNCGCCHSVYGFSLCDPDGEPTDDITLNYSVVIGNIHDNPELLKREGGR